MDAEQMLSSASIREAFGWGYRRVRTLIETPYRLPHFQGPSNPNGGPHIRLYRVADIVARARDRGKLSEEICARLVAAAKKETK